MPAISRWSSSAALSGCARPRKRSPISAPLNALPVGSTPSPASIGCSSSAASSTSSMKPNRRGSLKMMRDAGPAAVLHREDDMVVRVELRALVMEDARRRRRAALLDAERAGHAEMADQRRPAVEMRDQVFGAPAERGDPPSGERLGEAVRKGKAQIRPARLDLDDRARPPAPAAARAGRSRPRAVQALRGDGRIEGLAVPAGARPRCSATVSPISAKLRLRPTSAGLQARSGADDRHALARVVACRARTDRSHDRR